MAVINIHRMLDDLLLGSEHKCESVTMVEVYTAVIDGQEHSCQIEPEAPGKEDHVARYLASQATPPSADNAAQEGAEIEEPPPEEEHDPHSSHPHQRSKPHRKK